MDRNRIVEISSMFFRRILQTKKFVLDAETTSSSMRKGIALGIKDSQMRAFVIETIVEQANLALGGDYFIRRTSSALKLSPQIKQEIESVLFFDLMREKRVRFNKHEISMLIKECASLGVTEEEAKEFLRHIVSKLMDEALT